MPKTLPRYALWGTPGGGEPEKVEIIGVGHFPTTVMVRRGEGQSAHIFEADIDHLIFLKEYTK